MSEPGKPVSQAAARQSREVVRVRSALARIAEVTLAGAIEMGPEQGQYLAHVGLDVLLVIRSGNNWTIAEKTADNRPGRLWTDQFTEEEVTGLQWILEHTLSLGRKPNLQLRATCMEPSGVARRLYSSNIGGIRAHSRKVKQDTEHCVEILSLGLVLTWPWRASGSHVRLDEVRRVDARMF